MIESMKWVLEYFKGGEEMDKGSNRISIKINGNEKSVETDSEKAGSTNSINSSKPSDEEILQPFSYKKEMAAAKEEENDEFSWVLPNEDDQSRNEAPPKIVQIEDVRNKYKKENPYFSMSKQKKSSFNRIQTSFIKTFLVSVVLAVIVGLGLGALILNLMSAGESEQAVGTPSPTQPVTGGAATGSKGEEKENQPSAGAAELKLEPINVAYVQEGVYKNKEAVDQLVESIKQSGFAATTIEMDGSHSVIVGIGTDKEMIKEIGNLYADRENKEPFHKSFEVAGGSFTKVNENDANYIKDAQAFFTQLLSLSSNSFSSKSISDEQWSSISTLQENIKGKVNEEMSDGMKSFSTALTNAYNHLATYKESTDQATLLKSQQELLNAFQLYQEWTASLS
ncbi:SPOR domain-containing protein [Bacillus sp. PS06]|uniref:SPOR domain-containing protein n=1 Tax=Bacillus sp. PS06 TaxID=2764176 RepID=UPI00177CEE6A|nr:hypothetical protein [Bacillus sp. PS06]MBD8068845.1 hypothetical protein [Bacillus sp. PS06]